MLTEPSFPIRFVSLWAEKQKTSRHPPRRPIAISRAKPPGSAQNTMIEIQERYGRQLDAEAHWGTKWKQLVDLLVSNEAS